MRQVTVKDKGWKALKRKYKELDGAGVKVGVLAEAGKYSGGPNIALVAAVLHYGREGSNKKWPFITDGLKKGRSKIQNVSVKVVKQMTDGTLAPRKGLDFIGLAATASVKRQIQTVTAPALDERTIGRKRSSKPLIDTGQLLNSINHEGKI